jgi:putative RecB family exonuclease
MYVECPQKFKFRYLDKLPEKPKPFFSFGRSVHSALEFFYGVAALPAPTLEQVLASYKANWVSEGYKDAEEERKYFADGEKILRGFHAKHLADFEPPFFAEYRFDLKVDGVPVTGFVDRIDKVGTGGIAIVDYKTGKAFGEDRVRTDAQLTMYQMACEELLGLKVERMTFYHLNSLTPVTGERHSDGQVRQLRERIVTVADSIQKGLFEPTPEEAKCRWCDFKPHCPVFRDGDGFLPEPQAAAVPPQPDDGLAALVDRYGRVLDEAAALKAELAAALEAKGWVRAFGASHEVALVEEPRWEFRDKAKVLDVIKKAGLWDDILAPSAPLVQKLMDSAALAPEVRRKLESLGEKVERRALRCEKIVAR